MPFLELTRLVKESLSDEARAAVIKAAQSLVGTPYQNQGRNPGVAIDCGGVIICTGQLSGKTFMHDVRERNYSRWPWVGNSFYKAFRERMDEIPPEEAGPGDVLMFFIRRARTPQHCGVIENEKFMIHTPFQRVKKGGVYKTPRVERTRWTSQFWQTRVYAAFRFRPISRPEADHKVPSKAITNDVTERQ